MLAQTPAVVLEAFVVAETWVLANAVPGYAAILVLASAVLQCAATWALGYAVI